MNEFTKRFTSRNLRFKFESFESMRPCITKDKNEELTKIVHMKKYMKLSHLLTISKCRSR